MHTPKLIFPLCLVTSMLLTACGGGGGGGESPPPPDTPPPQPDPTPATLDIADVAVDEGDSGTTDAAFTVTLSAAAADDVTVDYATSNGSARAGSDYTAANGTLTVTAGDTEASIVVSVLGDTAFEANETFAVTLSNPSANAALGSATAIALINNDDFTSQPAETGLNDTGILGCSTEIDDLLSCNDAIVGTDDFPRQDAEYGRDFTANDDGDGRAGFAFLKLDAAGHLLADQSASFAASPWECVEDAVTGLVWEVKTEAAGSDRDRAATYSWRNSSGIDDGGNAGVANSGDCPANNGCDTEAYVAAVNAAELCGITTWRLPDRGELLSLVDYGASGAPFIDSDYFPNTAASAHWTAEPDLQADVRSVDFATGESRTDGREAALTVRLVSSGDVQ